jgi:hypothetical protein
VNDLKQNTFGSEEHPAPAGLDLGSWNKQLATIAAAVADPHINVAGIVIGGWWEYSLKGLKREDGSVVRWPRSKALVDAGPGSWPSDTLEILGAWKERIRGWTDAGVAVYVVKCYPMYKAPWNTGMGEVSAGGDIPDADYDNTGQIEWDQQGGPSRMKMGGANKLVPDLTPYLAPHKVADWDARIGFIAEPLFAAAEAAGAVLLDPASSLCLNGLCPLVDPAGWPAFDDSHHLSPTYTEVYGSFLDVTVELQGVARQPHEYCV